MGQEIELKLEVPRKAIRRSTDLPWLLELACSPAKHEKLTSVYFDTPKCKLRDHGVSLRVRHVGRKRLQTIKVIQKRAGPLGRDEWEEEITGTRPDLKRIEGAAFAPLNPKKLRGKLRPVFETVVERAALPVRIGRSEIEVAVDRGSIKVGRHREAINEIELELKSGDPAELALVAERFAQSLPVAYGARSKQDRGYALVAGQATGAIGASRIFLDRRCSTAQAFQVIALACLDHALANERAVRARDPEGVHQMRVGLRRLRATLSLFKPLVEGAETDTVKAELKWLTDQLAPARDLDVLIAEGVRPLQGNAPAAEFRTLAGDLENKRDKGFDRAQVAVDGGRYRALGLKTALWVISGDWTRSGDEVVVALRERPAVEFAAEILGKRLKKILKRADKIEDLDPRRRHKLRIAVKKLRYAAEFFTGLFDEGEGRGFSRQLKELQSGLGRLNDIEVHKRVAQRIVHRDRGPHRAEEEAFAMGFLTGGEQTEVDPALARVAKSAKRLKSASAFWQ